jgi:hypothetical protein
LKVGVFFETNEAQVPLSNAESPQSGPIDDVTIETLQLSIERESDTSVMFPTVTAYEVF